MDTLRVCVIGVRLDKWTLETLDKLAEEGYINLGCYKNSNQLEKMMENGVS